MNFSKLKFGATIGIIGGGQLGKMMAQSAQKMGYKVIVLDPNEGCPCRYVAHQFIHANYDDEQALNQLGENSDVVTYEFENISSEQLKKLTQLYHIPQGYQAIELLQDRLTEKQTLLEANTQIVPFVHLDIKKEVSLTVTIGNEQQTTYFPLQENEHQNQILFKTVVPARTDKEYEARKEVEKITRAIHFVGTFTVEFFIDKEDNLYVNEIAPRPHNSGHYSIEACDYSQFDTHILAITGQKLPQAIELLKPTVMMNLLGRDLDLLENEFSRHPDWHIHIYGKKERKPDRKMGHMTLLTDDVNQTEQYMLMKFEGRDK